MKVAVGRGVEVGGSTMTGVAEAVTALGVGWNMHFGWVEISDAGKMCNAMWNVSVLDNPVLHMPDGSADVLAMSDVPMADPATSPRLDHARLVDCLERLAERERSVLVMTFYDDQPARDVAAALGLSEGNVRVIRHRGIERLRDCVSGRGAPT